MPRKHFFWTSLVAGTGLIALILDAQTALSGATDGVNLCIYTVIPALFPFFVLTSFINSTLSQYKARILRPIGRLCAIPEGTESILLLGLLGGYPVGARCIVDAYRDGNISKSTAERLLGFCSNAGPAFLFGMMGSLFQEPHIPWLLWTVHILSALITGAILPRRKENSVILKSTKPITLSQAVIRSVKSICLVCGWVILFRVLIAFLDRWFLSVFPVVDQVVINGILELSNGAYQLNRICSNGCKFVLSALMLAFGGVCVAMQTSAVTEELGTGLYFPGKVIQSSISFLLAYAMQYTLFAYNERWDAPLYLPIILLCALVPSVIHISKINSRNFERSIV